MTKKEKLASHISYKFYLELCEKYHALEDVRNRNVGQLSIRAAFASFALKKFYSLYGHDDIIAIVGKSRTMSNYYLDRHKFDYNKDSINTYSILYTYWYDKISNDWEQSSLVAEYERELSKLRPE